MTSVPARLFVGGRVFDGTQFLDSVCVRTDASGRIIEIAEGLHPSEGEEVVDVADRLLMPGLVDCHVHFREPGLVRKEGYFTGSQGALHGGVTTVMEIQNNPPLMENGAVLDEKIANLKGVSFVDYVPYGSLTEHALETLHELKGKTPAVKCFLGCSTGAGGVKDEDTMRRLFQKAAEVGLKIVAHCEDNELMDAAAAATPVDGPFRHDVMRPAEAEIKSIDDAIRVAGEVGAVLHVFHISTFRGGQLVVEAAERGQAVTGTTAPHYLLVDAEEAAEKTENRFKVNPSIKAPSDREGLIGLVAEGKLQGVGTDHAPHPLEEKSRPYPKAPSGFPSIDLLLPLLFSAHDRFELPLERALASVTQDPAEEFGLHQKGRIAVGADADLVVCSPKRSRVVQESDLLSKSKWSPYHGRTLRGFPELVYLRGREVFADGAVVGEPRGRPLFS